jgi:hypothetical protein
MHKCDDLKTKAERKTSCLRVCLPEILPSSLPAQTTLFFVSLELALWD